MVAGAATTDSNQPTRSQPLAIVCDWLPPAFGAVGQYELARAYADAAKGQQVVLIGLGHPAAAGVHAALGGMLEIHRLPAGDQDKTSLLRRLAWAMGRNWQLASALHRLVKSRGPLRVKVTGSPPFLAEFVLLWRVVAGRAWRGTLVTFRTTDFYPETAFAAGHGAALRPVAPILRRIRGLADRFEALSACQMRRLLEGGVPENRITIVPDRSPVTILASTRPAPTPFDGDGEGPILLYSGNLGVAHDWRTFAEGWAAHVRRHPHPFRLWLNAAGVGVEQLTAWCAAHDLPCRQTSPVSIDELPGVLCAADAHLVLLGDPFWGFVFPSKTWGCLESGRPCLYIGPQESEVHALLTARAGGEHVSLRQGDAAGVADHLDRLASEARGAKAPGLFVNSA